MPRIAILPTILLATALASAQTQPEPGITHALAQARAARLSDIRYNLEFAIHEHESPVNATEFLTFTSATAGDLPIDFRDGDIQAAAVNGQQIGTTPVNGHLILPVAAGKNTVSIAFTANAAPSGKAITRYTDKDDGKEYFYTLFVPMDASMAFPCFDQPDLKARFTLRVDHPYGWTVIANAAATDDAGSVPDRRASFPETRPISTYLFAFAAGPFARIPGKNPAEPALYVRQSQLAKAQQEAPEVQSIAAQGIAWLADYFAQPFPFPKYDLVLIPGFPFGGMEHAGATFLNEDGVLFRSTPTASDYFKRDILVLHETTHQWFGDLVTMRWFDDLWLKEGFAQYMAYKAMAALKPPVSRDQPNPWKHFNEDIKPLAYAIDETQGTTPIFQQIPNLKDAKSAYGAIVYQKAPAVLKQLNFKLGDTIFRDGLRLYLQQHAYKNATWQDLIDAFTQAGGKDVQPWADAWITRRGMPEITATWSCTNGHLATLQARQRDILGTDAVWPIATELVTYNQGQTHTLRLDLYTKTTWLADFDVPCPDYIFLNHNDQAYGRVLLDPTSQKAVTEALGSANAGTDPLLQTQLWTALWENVRTAHTPARDYAELALRTLPTEPDESLARIQGARIAQTLHFYLGPPGVSKSREALLPQAERVVEDRMLHAPTLGLRIVNFRTFVSIAETRPALDELKRLLEDPDAPIPGLTLKPLDRWTILAHLAQQAEPHTADLIARELHEHHTGEDQKYAYAAQAAIPTAQTKARYFADYTGTKIQEDWLTQSLRSFNSPNQQPLTLPYLKQSLDLLPEIKRTRKIFFLGAWLSAVLDGQTTPAAQAIVNHWLDQPGIDPDLRLKVLENKDALDRTVLIRHTFPN